ncbi:MAG: nickel-dependent lactate racemase [Desulfobacteraceae bacterium]|jgi:nickel-dependent lactate racemase|nr:MAG: nickel-dependent lactate racemase [Desulfobacteraceae bacterium]
MNQIKISIPFDETALGIEIPSDAVVYQTSYPLPSGTAALIVMDALRRPVWSLPLKTALAKRRNGEVVIVVSDITRPIPYREFLPEMLDEITSAGVSRDDIRILVATGMHRPSTEKERRYMFGDIANQYKIEDHDAEGALEKIEGRSHSGRLVFLNKSFVNAGFRIITGLVEPHFMAGFSGGRKAVCPGLVSLETIQTFHGYDFLNSANAVNANLDGNPCHQEALSVARHAGVDFSLNVVLDTQKRVIRAFAGDLEAAHLEACAFVRDHACPGVLEEADVVLTGCGGYPLDATFYQCVKGIVAAIPAVKPGGLIIAAGGCREKMGSAEYCALMRSCADDYRGFLHRIRSAEIVDKDQWQFQMQTRALEKVGNEGIVMFSVGLDDSESRYIAGRHQRVSPETAAKEIQAFINALVSSCKRLAVIPEGPYCTPVSGGNRL